MTSAPDWLTAAPVAHRGLHGLEPGIVENLPSAFEAAIQGGYAIECDLQLSGDGEAMVFHDSTLDRLTEATGKVRDKTAGELKSVPFKDTPDRMQSLDEMLEQVAGKATLVIELKVRNGDEGPLEKRTAKLLADYKGHAAVMSFNPTSMGWFAANAPGIVRGQLSTAYDDGPGRNMPAWQRFALRHMLYNWRSRPHFIGYDIRHLPTWSVTLRRNLGLPILTWTVRTEHDRDVAAAHADQIIFETFRA